MLIETKIGNIAADHIDCGLNTPLLIIAHGRGSHRNKGSKKFAEYLQNFNISTLRVDLYGYGESDGKLENITITTAKESVLGAIRYAKENLKYSHLFLYGVSYGGSGILGGLNELSPNDISGLIFRCTILNYWNKTLREYSEKDLKVWKEKGFMDEHEGKLNYDFIEDMKNYTEIDYSKLGQFKTLYFHAGKDTKVLLSEVEEAQSKIPENFQVVIYPNSVHGIDIEEDYEDMMVRIREFIQKIS